MEILLLEIFFELYFLNNKVENWSLKEFQKNTPRLVRLQMIDALFVALNIKCSYSEFLNGEFINDDSLYDWNKLKNIISKKYKKGLDHVYFQDKDSSYELQAIFKELFEYRLMFEKLISKKRGVLAASGVHRIPINLMNEIDHKMTKEFAGIEQILTYLINPGGLQYSEQELNLQFGYPIVDLFELDLDWL
jgi:hypothetical protein